MLFGNKRNYNKKQVCKKNQIKIGGGKIKKWIYN
jgi:hypothetical protein